MFEITPLPHTNVIDVVFTGGISVDDERRLHAALDSGIAEHGTVRLLARVGAFDVSRFEPKAMLLDAQAARFLPHIERAALVIEPGVLKSVSDAAAHLFPHLEWRSFAPDAEREALDWIRA